jgi:hypothetical protein
MEVSGQLHTPATLPPGNKQPLPGLEPPIIQSVAQRYATKPSRLQRNERKHNIYPVL